MPELSRILDMLDRDGGLELDNPDHPARDQPSGAETHEIDFKRLFPSSDPGLDGENGYEFYRDPWEISDELVEDLVSRAGSGSGGGTPPQWDVWAWYQPIHFYGPDWGIFITQDGLIECARGIAGFGSPPSPGLSRQFAKATVRAAFAVLFLHEQYHHKIESAAIRMHVIEERVIYPSYQRAVYRPARGTNDLIEEGLANADSWRRLKERAHHRWIGRSISRATREYLADSFLKALPGYSNAQYQCSTPPFRQAEDTLLASVQEAQFPPKRVDISDFDVATNLSKSLFTLAQRIWTIVPPGAQPILPTQPPITPLQTKRLERFIQKKGFSPVKGAGKGSHQKYTDGNGQMIILRSEKEASLGVLKSTAEALDMNVTRLKTLAGQM